MEAGVQARVLLAAGNIQDARLLAKNDIIRLPNVLLPAMKIREYIGPSLTQVALGLAEGEVSQLIELDGRFHLLVSVKKMISNAPLFDDFTPINDKRLTLLNLRSKLDCLETSITPPIVLHP